MVPFQLTNLTFNSVVVSNNHLSDKLFFFFSPTVIVISWPQDLQTSQPLLNHQKQQKSVQVMFKSRLVFYHPYEQWECNTFFPTQTSYMKNQDTLINEVIQDTSSHLQEVMQHTDKDNICLSHTSMLSTVRHLTLLSSLVWEGGSPVCQSQILQTAGLCGDEDQPFPCKIGCLQSNHNLLCRIVVLSIKFKSQSVPIVCVGGVNLVQINHRMLIIDP